MYSGLVLTFHAARALEKLPELPGASQRSPTGTREIL